MNTVNTVCDVLLDINRLDIPVDVIQRTQMCLDKTLHKRKVIDGHDDNIITLDDYDVLLFIPPLHWGLRSKVEVVLMPKKATYCAINPVREGEYVSTISCGPTVNYSHPKTMWGDVYGLYPIYH